MSDIDVLEQEQDEELELGQEDQSQDKDELHGDQDDEPKSEPQDRQSIRDAALSEGVEEAIVSELAEKQGELTIEDLRKLPGAEDYTNEQLKSAWANAVKSAGAGTQTADDEGSKEVELPFPVYDKEGNKVAKPTLEGLLDGSLQIGYTALGKEQRKALQDVIRNASMGHWNEQKYQTTVEERNRVAQQYAEVKKQVDQFTQERQVWDAALTALAMGNPKPMEALATAFQKALQSAPATAAPGLVPADQVAREREEQARGFEAIQTYIIPKGLEIAQRYSAKPEEVLGAIEWFIKQEPAQFFTKEKLDAILQYEVPQLFEAHGYKASTTAQQQTGQKETPNELEELKKTVAALQSQIAGKKNESTQQVREKTKKAPPPGSGTVGGATDGMPAFKNRAQMKAWMQNDPDWAKA